MSIDRLGNELEALGVSGRDIRSLLLLPQIYVGWTFPRRDVPALEALLDTTARRASLAPGGLGLARGWLFERPTRAQFQSAFALLRALRRTPERPLITSSDLLEAMLWAVRAARLDPDRATGNAGGGLLKPVVWRALNDLEGWLEVDTTDLWTDILIENEEGPRSTRSPVAPERAAPAPAGPASAFGASLSDLELEHATAVLDVGGDDDLSEVRGRQDAGTGPASAPFPLLRRLA